MPLGHLMIGLMGGLAGFAAALLAGLPIWVAALLYTGIGNLCVVLSMVAQLLANRRRRPPRRRAPRRKAGALRPLRAPH